MMAQRKQTMGQVESDVIAIIAKRTKLERAQITRDRRLVDVGIVDEADVEAIIMATLARYLDLSDPLDVVEISMNIEEEFGVSASSMRPPLMPSTLGSSTVGDVIDYIHELLTHVPKPN